MTHDCHFCGHKVSASDRNDNTFDNSPAVIHVREGEPIEVKIEEDLFNRETNGNESVEITLPDGRKICVWGNGDVTVTDANYIEMAIFDGEANTVQQFGSKPMPPR